MSMRAIREVRLVLPMEPNAELKASEAASVLATSQSMSPDKIDEIRAAVVEACVNALEHSRAPDQVIHVLLAVMGSGRPEEMRITVRDSGVGFLPDQVRTGKSGSLDRPQKRGWGLEIIRGLMDQVKISSSENGTEVEMTKRF